MPEPIVYEDFLPRSAAGIFRSNLADEGVATGRERECRGTRRGWRARSAATVHDPMELYAAQVEASWRRVRAELEVVA